MSCTLRSRLSLRWRLSTLVLAILVAGLIVGGIALRQRSEHLRQIAEEYAAWDNKLSRVMPILDDAIERDRREVALTESEIRVFPGIDQGRLGSHRSRLAKRLAIRSKFSDLREHARGLERRYSNAASHPWESVPAAEPIAPTVEALRAEFFPPTGER